MTPFWVLQKDKAAASAVVSGKELILENRYLRRVIDTETGRTVSIKDGDGEEAISASCREGSFSADGIFHELSGPCRIRIMDGNLTEKKFDYAPRPYNTHPFPYPAPGKTAELFYDFGPLEARLVYEIFDDMPLIRKTLYVKNNAGKTVVIDTAETEALVLSETGQLRLYLESDYTGNNGTGFATETSIFRDGNGVSARFDMGPDFDLQAGETFRGMQVYELYCQSSCRSVLT